MKKEIIDFMEIKRFCASKDSWRKWKDNVQNGRKYSKIIHLAHAKSPLDCKEIKPVNPPKGPEYSLEGLMLKLKRQYFGHLIQTDLLENTLMLGKSGGGRRRGWKKMRWLDDITNSMDMN